MIFAQSNDGVGDPQISGVHHRFENVALPNIRGQSVCTVYLKHQRQEVIVQLWAGLVDVTLFCHCIKKMWEKKTLIVSVTLSVSFSISCLVIKLRIYGPGTVALRSGPHHLFSASVLLNY